MQKRRKPVTLEEVARKADVSTNTASRALKGDRRVTVETTRRVRIAAEELGYESSGEPTGLLGLVTPRIAHAFYGELLEHIQDYAAQRGYLMTFARTDGNDVREQRVIEDLDAARVEGLILLSSTMSEVSLARVLADGRRPVVAMNASFKPRPGLLCITVKNDEGVRQVMEHLSRYGHGNRVAYLNGPASSRSNATRRMAYQQALAERNLTLYWQSTPVSQPADYETGRRAGIQMLEETTHALPSVVTAYNDLMALGCMAALLKEGKEGLEIPKDISIVGFDDLGFADFTNPRLTTVRIPRWQMATAAVTELIHMIEEEDLRRPREDLSFAPTFIERDSLGQAAPVTPAESQ